MHPWLRPVAVLADLLFPADCPGCERTLGPEDGEWCRACAETLVQEVAQPHCPRCGARAGLHMVDPGGCPECRGHRLPLEGIAIVGPYHGFLGDVLKKYKYGREHRLDRPLGQLLAAAVQGRDWSQRLDALVPIPTNWRGRLRYRSYTVGLLAEQVGWRLRLPVLPVMRLRGKRRRQVELSHTERPGNVRGVFHVERHARLTGATVCIIDDVSTTGSTVREAARVLKAAGATAVYAGVLVKTDPDRSDAVNV